MSLRAIPNLYVFRPANANEAIFSIIESLKLVSSPSAIALSRQNLQNNNIDLKLTRNGVKKGAYIIQDLKKPDFVIFASGSEVEKAIEINQHLGSKGRIISVPCWELFEKQTKSYKNKILSFDCKKRISIEAGISQGWEKFVGLDGLPIGINSYGFSAPGEEVAKTLKFDRKNILKKIKLYLKK
jgi:transketolase